MRTIFLENNVTNANIGNSQVNFSPELDYWVQEYHKLNVSSVGQIYWIDKQTTTEEQKNTKSRLSVTNNWNDSMRMQTKKKL